MNEGIAVHRSKEGKLDGFLGYMPQVPRKGEVIFIGIKPYKIKQVLWVYDRGPKAWEARLELEYWGVDR